MVLFFRVAVLQEPLRPDSKSSESWAKLFTLMRQHILQAFNVNVNRYKKQDILFEKQLNKSTRKQAECRLCKVQNFCKVYYLVCSRIKDIDPIMPKFILLITICAVALELCCKNKQINKQTYKQANRMSNILCKKYWHKYTYSSNKCLWIWE